VILAGCFGSSTTEFPEGLEPLEDNEIEAWGPPFEERMEMVDGDSGRYWYAHARGYLLEPPAAIWETFKQSELMATVCSTDSHSLEEGGEPEYEHSFEVHYFVDELVNVEWDEQWRYGTVEGTPEAPELMMIRYQKVYGSDLIRLIEGSILLLATDDEAVTEVQMIEHVNAAGGGVADIRKSMQYRFDSVAAVVRGGEQPDCP
jgi:hypothetical protein